MFLSQLEQLPVCRVNCRKLGPEVSQDLVGHPDVLLDESKEGLVLHAPLEQLQGWNAQSLLVYLRVVTGVAAGDPPPISVWWAMTAR